MTDKDFEEGSSAFELGYLDGIQGTKARLHKIATGTPTDGELSDYWFGYHHGRKAVTK